MENLTVETFKEKIYDYSQNVEWSFKGTKPVIIDFYADWCNPCKMVAGVLEELSNEYPAIDFYKVDIDTENELASIFSIRSIPSILFIPVSGQPQMSTGAAPKSKFQKVISDILNIE